MTRWSLSNIFRAVTHTQFIDYSTHFKQAAEHAFNTECRLDIRALQGPKLYTTFMDKHIQDELDERNAENTILATEDLADITPDLWKQAGYIEVTVRPVDEKKAPDFAFGHAEFKGCHPRQATFYIQPDGEEAKQFMTSQNRGKITGNGFESNGTSSKAIPASLKGFGLRF